MGPLETPQISLELHQQHIWKDKHKELRPIKDPFNPSREPPKDFVETPKSHVLLSVTLEISPKGPLTQEGSREPPQKSFHTLKFLKKIKSFKSQRPFEPHENLQKALRTSWNNWWMQKSCF